MGSSITPPPPLRPIAPPLPSVQLMLIFCNPQPGLNTSPGGGGGRRIRPSPLLLFQLKSSCCEGRCQTSDSENSNHSTSAKRPKTETHLPGMRSLWQSLCFNHPQKCNHKCEYVQECERHGDYSNVCLLLIAVHLNNHHRKWTAVWRIVVSSLLQLFAQCL